MTKTQVEYREYLIYADAVRTVDDQFSAEVQVAGPSGLISFTALGLFDTAPAAKDHATHWIKEWIDSGIAEQALADAINKNTPDQTK